MTRDQAIQAVRRMNEPDYDYPTRFVNILEALGLLKFDTPKSAEDVMNGALSIYGVHNAYAAEAIVSELENHGYKIVKK